jgi:hypothetical protein
VNGVLDHIKTYFTDSIGRPAIARELLRQASIDGIYKHYCETFTRMDWPHDGNKETLHVVLQSATKDIAQRFLEDEASSREQFEQLSSILNTKESIKAQGRMEVLTIVSVAIAIASLVVATFALKD